MGSRDVIGHVTIRLPNVDFLFMVHSDRASIRHRYGDMAPQISDARTLTRKERRKKKTRKRKTEERKGKWKGKKKGKRKEERNGR